MPSAIFEHGGQLYRVPYEGAWTPEKQRAAMERLLRGELAPLPAQEAARLRRELAARASAPAPQEAAAPQPSWLAQAREAIPWPVWTLASLAAPFAASWAAPALLARLGAPAAIAGLTKLAAPVAAIAGVEAARSGEVDPSVLLSLGAPVAAGGAAARWAPGLVARGAAALASPAAKEAAKQTATKWATRLAGPTARVATTAGVEAARGEDWMLPTLAQGVSEVIFGPGAHVARRVGMRGKKAAEEAAKPLKEELKAKAEHPAQVIARERTDLTNALVDRLRSVVEPWRNFPRGVKGLEAIMREPAGRHALGEYYAEGLKMIRDLVRGREIELPPEIAMMVRKPETIIKQVELPGRTIHLVDAAEAIEGVARLSPEQKWRATRAIEHALDKAGLHPAIEAWQTIRRNFREGVRWLQEFGGQVPVTRPGKAEALPAAAEGLVDPNAILRRLAERRWQKIKADDEVARVARDVVQQSRRALEAEAAAREATHEELARLREQLRLYQGVGLPAVGLSSRVGGVHLWSHPRVSYYPGIPRTPEERASSEQLATLGGLWLRWLAGPSE